MQTGKVVGGVRYIHKSVLSDPSQFSEKERVLLQRGLLVLPHFTFAKGIILEEGKMRYTIIALDVKENKISFTDCPDWDTNPEPSLGQCLTIPFKGHDSKMTFRKATAMNPQIYHRRHLFVLPGYTGFDIQKDIARVQAWAKLDPDKNRMGRRLWWDVFLHTHHL
jgi:hypothetical protein